MYVARFLADDLCKNVKSFRVIHMQTVHTSATFYFWALIKSGV